MQKVECIPATHLWHTAFERNLTDGDGVDWGEPGDTECPNAAGKLLNQVFEAEKRYQSICCGSARKVGDVEGT